MSTMPPPPSNSWVTSATFTTDNAEQLQISLTVQVDDFLSGQTVEISGHATQENGAFANYYDIQKVPDPVTGADGKSHKNVTVTTHPLPPNNFMQGQPITIVLRVSKVWVTVLTAQAPGTTVFTTSDPAKPAVDGTTWNYISVVSSIDGDNWTP
jgi:hypothetical protein